MIRKLFILSVVFTFGFLNQVNAQLYVINDSISLHLAQYLAGSGVSVANASVNCSDSSIGTFHNGGTTNLGLDSGVVLSTGNISAIPDSGGAFATMDEAMPDDSDLDNLEGIAFGQFLAYDACTLQFDVTPAGDTLSFRYVFGSEEYPEYVCSQFNDVFGFFISGPNPAGGSYATQNIALIPGTNIPVSINTVNPGVVGLFGNGGGCQSLAYASDYIDNTSGQWIVYDGLTTVFTASIPVVACQVYHLKLGIEDVGDGAFDSGVFIEASSLSSRSSNVIGAAAVTGGTATYRGCEDGIFTFSIPQPSLTSVVIHFTISGTAINGTDYTNLPDSVVIPAGDSTASLILNPLLDGGNSPSLTVIISIITTCNDSTSTSSFLTINEVPPAFAAASPDTLCSGQSTQLHTINGVAYLWSGPGLSNDTAASPFATPLVTSTYTVTATDSALCTATASVTVLVSSSDTVALSGTDASCGNSNGADTAIVTFGTGPFIYIWSNGATSQVINGLNVGNYSVTVTAAGGCSATASSTIQASSGLILSSSFTNTSCGNSDGSAVVGVTSGTGPFIYLWSNGSTTDSLNNLASGTYLVTVSNSSGCSATASIIINPSGNSGVAINADKTLICSSDSANVCAPAGYSSYLWNTGETTQCIYTQTAGNYYLTVTDTAGCMATSNQLAISVYPQPPVPISVNGDTLRAYNSNSYQWYLNGQALPGDTSSMLIATETGNYSVGVTDSNGCAANSSNQFIQLSTDIITISNKGGVKVYPNPLITGGWQVELSNDSYRAWLGGICELYDAGGKLVYQLEIHSSKFEIDLSVAQGVYLFRIFSGTNNATLKLVKL